MDGEGAGRVKGMRGAAARNEENGEGHYTRAENDHAKTAENTRRQHGTAVDPPSEEKTVATRQAKSRPGDSTVLSTTTLPKIFAAKHFWGRSKAA